MKNNHTMYKVGDCVEYRSDTELSGDWKWSAGVITEVLPGNEHMYTIYKVKCFKTKESMARLHHNVKASSVIANIDELTKI